LHEFGALALGGLKAILESFHLHRLFFLATPIIRTHVLHYTTFRRFAPPPYIPLAKARSFTAGLVSRSPCPVSGRRI
jgi:hypothetical protein